MRTVSKFFKMRIYALAGLVLLVASCAKDDPQNRSPRLDTEPAVSDVQNPQSSHTSLPQPTNIDLNGDQVQTPPIKNGQSLDKPAEIFTSGEKGFKLEAYKLPEVILQRQIRRGETPQLPSNAYQMHSADLVMDLDRSEMRLKVDIEANGRREQIALAGAFDKLGQVWEGQLLAVDPKIKSERRIQAVVLCIRPHICDQVWMDLYYYINGKLERRQFVSGADPVMIPISESLSIPLPEADENGLVTLPAEFVQAQGLAVPEEEAPQGSGEAEEAQVATPPMPRPRPQHDSQAQAPATQSGQFSEDIFKQDYPQDPELKAALEAYIQSKAQGAHPKEEEASAVIPPMPRPRPQRPSEPIVEKPAEPQISEDIFKQDYPQNPELKAALEAYIQQKTQPEEKPVEMPPLPRPRPSRPPMPAPLSQRPTPEEVAAKTPEATVKIHQDELPLEYSTEMQLALPADSEFRVQGAEALKVDVGDDTRWGAQAIGSHTNGSLKNALQMPASGCGFKRRNDSQSWGTGLLLEIITEAACIVEKQIQGFPLLIGGISLRYGGDGGQRNFGHSSHRTGLDVDLGIYHRNKEISQFWNPLENNFSENFDYERNWKFLKALHSTDEKRVMIVFLDTNIKKKMCNWVKQNEGLPTDTSSPSYRALRYLSHWAGHANHYHVRLYCPGTRGCVNKQADPRFSGTGC